MTGRRVSGAEIEELLNGLGANGLLTNYTHVLTGYMADATALLAVTRFLSSAPHRPFFLCDPVLGDNGKLYVPQEFVPLYRTTVIPLANLITPNQFEAEYVMVQTLTESRRVLSERKLRNQGDALSILAHFHQLGPEHVVVTSSTTGPQGTLTLHGSTRHQMPFSIQIPELPGTFTGTGDLFAALLLSHMLAATRDDYPLAAACQRALASMYGVLAATERRRQAALRANPHLAAAATLELCLIPSKGIIEDPPRTSMFPITYFEL